MNELILAAYIIVACMAFFVMGYYWGKYITDFRWYLRRACLYDKLRARIKSLELQEGRAADRIDEVIHVMRIDRNIK